MAKGCPECGSDRVVPIVYGMPSSETFEKAERGEVAIGGCCLVHDPDGELAMPDRSCRACATSFRRPRRGRPHLV